MTDVRSVDAADPSQRTPVRTWDMLKGLGFVEDEAVISDSPGELSLDFGNLKLEASHVLNRWCRPVVLLTGVIGTLRTVSLIQSEMPREVESRELGVAWLTWCLDSHAGGLFEPVFPVDWLTEGRTYRRLLPWERKQAAYNARPRCSVPRSWARFALRGLSEAIATVASDTLVILSFNGEVLTIRCKDRLVVMPASGAPWEHSYSISCASLHCLPKRLMSDHVEFSVFDGTLTIDRRSYREIVATDAIIGT